jgi:hypothetical protein
MRTRDLVEILDRFCKKSEVLGDTQVRIVLPHDRHKYFKIKEITFAPNKLVGQAEKYRMLIVVEE